MSRMTKGGGHSRASFDFAPAGATLRTNGGGPSVLSVAPAESKNAQDERILPSSSPVRPERKAPGAWSRRVRPSYAQATTWIPNFPLPSFASSPSCLRTRESRVVSFSSVRQANDSGFPLKACGNDGREGHPALLFHKRRKEQRRWILD